MKTTYHKIPITESTPIIQSNEEGTSLSTIEAYRQHGENPAELEELGYYIPLGNAPRVYLIEQFRFGWLSCDSYGKESHRVSKTLAGIRAAVADQLGSIHSDEGYVTRDGISRLTSFQARLSGGGWCDLPLRLALHTEADLQARYEALMGQHRDLTAQLEKVAEEARAIVDKLDAAHRVRESGKQEIVSCPPGPGLIEALRHVR